MSDFNAWWAVNHPHDWWAEDRKGAPLPHLDRLLVADLCRKAFEAGQPANQPDAAQFRPDGWVKCIGCGHSWDEHGDGDSACPTPDQQTVTCPECFGAGKRNLSDGSWAVCDYCDGRARVTAPKSGEQA
jgi:hypothetical protein